MHPTINDPVAVFTAEGEASPVRTILAEPHSHRATIAIRRDDVRRISSKGCLLWIDHDGGVTKLELADEAEASAMFGRLVRWWGARP